MSRTCVVNAPQSVIFVGWDNPMQRFFVQEWSGPKAQENYLKDEAPKVDAEYKTLDDLKTAYPELEPWVYDHLQSQYEARTTPSKLQQRVARMFGHDL